MSKTNLRLITPPAAQPVTLEAAKAWLRVDHADEDGLISALIVSATRLLDGRAGILGRCLEAQTWELALDAFPEAEIRLPLGPVASVASVKFTDPEGAEGTVDAGGYELDAAETFGAWLVPSAPWPATMETINAVRVRFVAGTGTPEPLRETILAMVCAGFETRASGRLLTPGIVADLAPFRRPVLAP